MTGYAPPVLALQPDVTRLPFGGAWWPVGRGLSHELLDLAARWPAHLPTIVGYAILPDNWDQTPTVPGSDADGPDVGTAVHLRTRTIILSLSDHSACRVLVIPPEAPPTVARSMLAEASDPASRWRRADFDDTFRPPTPHEPRVLLADGSDAWT